MRCSAHFWKMGTQLAWVVVAIMSVTLVGQANSAHILLYPFGHCFNSHLINFEKLAIILTEGGHHVDFLVTRNYENYPHHSNDQGYEDGNSDQVYEEGKSPQQKNSTTLQTFKAPDDFLPVCDQHDLTYMMTTPTTQRFAHLRETFARYCEAILSDNKLMTRLKNIHYDLFIFDTLDPCGRVLADYLDVLFIPLVTLGLGYGDGNPRPPSHVPSTLSTFSPSMTFYQRTTNLLLKIMFDIIPTIIGYDTPFEKLKRKYDINTTLSIATTNDRAAVKLVNSDFALEYPSPIEPDTVMIGGFSIDAPSLLKGNIKDIVNEAQSHGVIVFSFGTLISKFDSRYTKIFVDAFSRIQQTVIWKNGNSSSLQSQMPKNVHVMPWIPQNALLAHPSTRLFITHCGLNGAMEAAHFGVPVVAIPIADDQFNHANKLVNHLEMGVQLDVRTLSPDYIQDAITTVLTNISYSTNAKQVSETFKDQPMSKKDKVQYWVDWVLRHKGAPHFRSLAHKLHWYQYYSLDSISFFCALLAMIIWLLNLAVSCTMSSLLRNCNWYYKKIWSKKAE